MKKRNLFVTLGLALGLGIAGLTAATLSSDKVEREVKATEPVYSNIYLEGDFLLDANNNWLNPYGYESTYKENGLQFTYAYQRDDGYYYEVTHQINVGQLFAIRDWESGHESDWMRSYDGTRVLQGLDNYGNDNNFRCLMSGTYKVTYRWASSSDRCIVGFDLQDSATMFYISDNSTWATYTGTNPIYLHAWDSNGDLTSWGDGCKVNKIPSLTVGENDLYIYAIQIPSSASGFIIKHANGNTDYKTADLSIGNGLCYTGTGSADLGTAGAIIGNIYRHMGEYTYNSTTYYNSICAIDSSTRANIAADYKKLTAAQKAIVDNSLLITYDPTNLSQTTSIELSVIIARLNTNTSMNLPRVTIGNIFGADSNNTIIIIAIAGVSLLALAGFFLLKRKEDR